MQTAELLDLMGALKLRGMLFPSTQFGPLRCSDLAHPLTHCYLMLRCSAVKV